MATIIEQRATSNEPIRVSIAIASYNGEKYILEQLESIRTQTRFPDEVIIADDCSTDGTFELCEKFIAEHELTGWTVYQNPQNLGICANFRNVLKKCTGDYIFPCDQDDIWMPDKLEVMIKAMNDNPKINLLTSNYIAVINGKETLISLKHLDRDDGEIIQLKLTNSGLSNLRPGCTFCFRRELLDCFNVMDIPDLWHDALLWKYAIVRDGLFMINRQLIYYVRRGTSQLANLSPSYRNIDERIRNTHEAEELYVKFLDASDGLKITPANQKFLCKLMNFSQRRRKMLTKRNLFLGILFVMMNLKYYPTLRSALGEIYAMIFIR
ncbi:MAG: glycosyltransferase [Synergistaceae bacterium]|nr:glycosyltransferase [Synergistaceae bacterium]